MRTQRTRATGRADALDIQTSDLWRDVSWAISDILCRPRIFCGVVLMKVKALEGDTVDSLCFRYYGHDAGRHRKGAGCQPRTLSAGISGRRAGSGDAGAGEEETRNDSVVGGVAVEHHSNRDHRAGYCMAL
ncbi:Head completion/stabilization protein L [Escherichia coli]|nr:Head completion/stabilization protein L [Escherichia coli]